MKKLSLKNPKETDFFSVNALKNCFILALFIQNVVKLIINDNRNQ